MSVLSNVDIEKEIYKNKNIVIYPLNLDNIKSSSYNLTASSLAWSLNTKQRIVNNNVIIIPPNDSALIVTQEVIWVSKKISGTYHSKVSLVTKGAGHLGTTLDPTWWGHSLVTIHNHSDKNLKINVGDSFVTIMFYYLNKKTNKEQENLPNQSGQLGSFKTLNSIEKAFFEKKFNSSLEGLKEEFYQQDEYKELGKKYNSFKRKIVSVLTILFFLLIWVGGSYIYSFYQNYSYSKGFWLFTLTILGSGAGLVMIQYLVKKIGGNG